MKGIISRVLNKYKKRNPKAIRRLLRIKHKIRISERALRLRLKRMGA
jgi:hypothetical protein